MDYRDEIPADITAEWIISTPIVWSVLEKYMITMLKESGIFGASYHDITSRLSSGYRRLYLLLLFRSENDNGGFGQFICNSLAGDQSGSIIVETLAALRFLDLDKLAEMLEDAVVVFGTSLPQIVLDALPARKHVANAAAGDTSKSSWDVLERQLDPLDDLWSSMDESWSPKVDEYIRKHPDEFVHPGGKHAS